MFILSYPDSSYVYYTIQSYPLSKNPNTANHPTLFPHFNGGNTSYHSRQQTLGHVREGVSAGGDYGGEGAFLMMV